MRGRSVVILIAAVLGAGCGEDRGEVSVEGSTTGTGTTATATAPVTVDTTATDAAALNRAMDAVGRYARKETAALVTTTAALRRAVDAGDVPAARRAYAAARPHYERIEPLVAVFPKLDGEIDAREDDFPRKAADPGWTGFHPIERALWRDRRIDGRTRRLAAGLVADSRRLDDLMARAEIAPAVVIPGTAELIDEIEESKITGEEERYSKLDLPTFLANLEGGRAFYATLAPLVRDADPKLDERIENAFDDAFDEVRSLRRSGRFVAYDELTRAQQRSLKNAVEALAEPLARVQGTLGVRS
jgi:iron uptake system component EfeO